MPRRGEPAWELAAGPLPSLPGTALTPRSGASDDTGRNRLSGAVCGKKSQSPGPAWRRGYTCFVCSFRPRMGITDGEMGPGQFPDAPLCAQAGEAPGKPRGGWRGLGAPGCSRCPEGLWISSGPRRRRDRPGTQCKKVPGALSVGPLHVRPLTHILRSQYLSALGWAQGAHARPFLAHPAPNPDTPRCSPWR